MKVAVASKEYNLDSEVNPIFGRSSAFIIADVEEGNIKNISIIENPAKNETGAGNTAANFIVNQKVDILISGTFGPVAFHILKNAGITVYKITSGSVEKHLKRFIANKLEEVTTLSGGFPV